MMKTPAASKPRDAQIVSMRFTELGRRAGPGVPMTDEPSGIHRRATPLEAIPIDDLAEAASVVGGVRRRDLDPGDRIVVSTKNSVYSLIACADGTFEVSGGWFERQGSGPATVEILGCTAGGHAILTDHIAAPGLFLEFADGLRTTRIRTVRRIGAERRDR